MTPSQIEQAAQLLALAALSGERIQGLPDSCRPSDITDGYAVQAQVAHNSGRRIVGWKIAATSTAGQRHIGVDGPIAARLLSEHVVGSGLSFPMKANVMNVAEAEFAFRMKSALPPRTRPYSVGEVMDAVDTLHPALEIPDSRFAEFGKVGAAQLIADAACAQWLATGRSASESWRDLNLIQHEVIAYRNGTEAGRGRGENVLGDPRVALAWLANELLAQGQHLRAGDLVTTGACVAPMEVRPGDSLRADFGILGTVEASFH